MVRPSPVRRRRRRRPRSWIKGNRVSSVGDTRTLWLGGSDAPGGNVGFVDNRVVSAKYTLWNFIPKNLFEQFRRVANFYFLCMSIIAVSIESPVTPITSVAPLVFVILVTLFKQGYEDLLRHRNDRDVNNTLVTVIRNGCAQQVKSKLIQVGDLVQVHREEDVPCDLVLLASSDPEGRCFVTTANLDGETNLKILLCPRLLRYFSRPEQLASLRAELECEQPTPDLYKFYGKIEIFPDQEALVSSPLVLGATTDDDGVRSSHFEDDEQSIGVRHPSITSGSLRGVTVVTDQTFRTSQGTMVRRTSVRSLRASLNNREGPFGKVQSANNLTREDSVVSNAPLGNCVWTNGNVPMRGSKHSSVLEGAPLGHSSLKSVRLSQVENRGDPARRFSLGLSAPLGIENLLLRGTRLRNTEYIYGCAVYTGQETKLALNSKLTSNKFSTVEKSINKFLLFFLVLLMVEVLVCLGLKYRMEKKHADQLALFTSNEIPEVTAAGIIQDLLSFFILYNYIIPISLYVTIEMQKFLGTLFFEWDVEMYCPRTNEPAICNSSDLNEELGQVQFLFTDKTGTLTENNMKFRRCSVAGTAYLERDGMLFVLSPSGDEREVRLLEMFPPELDHFLLGLALCHSVQPGTAFTNNNYVVGTELDYQASSPDEKALVEAAARCGVVYLGEEGDFMSVYLRDRVCRYRKLDVLEFTSDRKRMSVVVEDEQSQLWLYCKGAESAVIPLADSGYLHDTQAHINDFAMRGLRTMVVGFRRLDTATYNTLSQHVELSRQTVSTRRESLVAASYSKMEQGLVLLGATGVEDQLQDGVQETLESLRAAGIKVWILTGDKVETAVNISFSCGHFKNGTEQLYLTGHNSYDSCVKSLNMFRERVQSERLKQFGLIVDGQSLKLALQEADLLRDVCLSCTAVICCRMSPLQKCEVVQLVKNSATKPITAAIGDGANDVSMIQEAHVGLGIMGKEGRQAVRCSDFAFARFRFLRKVLLVHGHWYYERISTLVQYFFYKNIVFITPQVYYAFYNAYSTQPLYDSLFLTLYNVFFTSLPILIYGLFEQSHSAETLLKYPQLYKDIAGNVHMTWRHFILWISFGLWHSLVLYYVPHIVLNTNPVIMYDNKPIEQWAFGSLIFHSVVVVANLKRRCLPVSCYQSNTYKYKMLWMSSYNKLSKHCFKAGATQSLLDGYIPDGSRSLHRRLHVRRHHVLFHHYDHDGWQYVLGLHQAAHVSHVLVHVDVTHCNVPHS
ncbi:phospholipid-transporting ATPase IF isoform X2 [Anabrus simplex]|uniref:phospholipid-transporting ATPase IF isoform X2 n=1 Tax=Anabrus simplex TaxID=316456 RepID=UPI0035A27DA6